LKIEYDLIYRNRCFEGNVDDRGADLDVKACVTEERRLLLLW